MGIKLKDVIKCANCNKKDALLWTKKPDSTIICEKCYEAERQQTRLLQTELPSTPKGNLDKPIILRKSTRMSRSYKTRSNQSQAKLTRGKKKTPAKQKTLRVSRNKLVSCTRVFVGDNYLQVGDIVSILGNDEKIYFAQVTGLFVDSVGEQSALITWLLPVQGAKPGIFEPERYVIGPSEDTPRTLTGMVFERRLPKNCLRYTAQPTVPEDSEPFRQTILTAHN